MKKTKVVLNKYIIKEGTVEEIGKKGYNLSILHKKNIKVPDFFCFNSRCFEEALDFRKSECLEKVEKIDFNDEESIESISDEITKSIDKIRFWEFEDKINVFLREKYNEEDIFSIRTSCNYEDIDSSENDMFDIYYNIKRSNIFEYIRKCWNFIYSVKFLKYAHENKIDMKDVRMAVVIQKMEKKYISGIAFTSNPKGLLNELVVIVGKGTNYDVLNRKVDTTSYHYNKESKLIFYEQKNKSITLDKESLKLIIDEILKIEESFWTFTEVHWSLSGDKLYILQVRKVLDFDKHSKVTILDNRDIVDKFPGVILPLTESFVKKAYAEVLQNIAKRTLPNKNVLEKYEQNFKNMICCVNGRMYCNLENWNLFLQFIPNGNKLLRNWQEKMGLLDRSKKNKPKKGFERKITSKEFRIINRNSKRLFRKNREYMNKFIRDFNEQYEYFRKRYESKMTNKELVSLYEEYVTKVFVNFDFTFINEIYTHIYIEKLKLKLKRVKVEDNDKFVTDYISDIYNNETEKFLRDLFEIANMVDVELESKLLSLDTNEKVRNFLYEDTELSNKLRDYIKEYGDIVLDSIKLESTTFKSDPKLLIDKILEYVRNRNKVKSIHGTLKNYENKDMPIILKKKTGIYNRSEIKELEPICREVVGYKEASDTLRAKLYGMVRLIFSDISRNLYNDGVIASINDIYYLKIDEIISYIKGEEIDLINIAIKRRQEYMCYFRLPSYNRLIFAGDIYNKYHVNINNFNCYNDITELNGNAFSRGITQKEVVVVFTKDDLKDVKNKIIVAETTDFGWFLDIAFSEGIITEYGSMFSGTSILARDLRIPYVSGIKNVTTIFKTGDIVKLDGNSGKIILLNNDGKRK